jgi:hypothetical protein
LVLGRKALLLSTQKERLLINVNYAWILCFPLERDNKCCTFPPYLFKTSTGLVTYNDDIINVQVIYYNL